jgi:hypothetical protein
MKELIFEVGKKYKNLYESFGYKDDEDFILSTRSFIKTNDVGEIDLELHNRSLNKKVHFYLEENVLKEITIDGKNVQSYKMFK